jgi:hypothetical protein
LLDIFLWDLNVLTNSFPYANLKKSNGIGMFNILKNSFMGNGSRGFSISSAIGLKKSLTARLNVKVASRKRIETEQINSQVRKVLEQKGQGLILMVRG